MTRWRTLLVIWGTGASALTLLLGLIGLGSRLPASPAAGIFALQGAYYLAAGSLVAMSRFRLPLVPLLLIGCASLLCMGLRPLPRPRLILAAGSSLILVTLWIIGWPTTLGLLKAASKGLGVFG